MPLAKKPATTTPAIQELISLMFTTGRLIREKSRETGTLDPISVLQLESLHFIGTHDRPTMKQVADHLSITPPSATSIIDALVKAKQIERAADTTDRRVVRLTLTTAGKKALEAGFKLQTKRVGEVLAKLDSEEQAHLVQILKKLQRVYQ
jgi:DNA-binding MarR family transcriptional regulator